MAQTVAVWVVAALLGASVAAQQGKPRFEVASVKRAASRTLGANPVPRAHPGGRFGADFATVGDLLWFAYGVRQDRIVGPDWVRQDRFEINARAATDVPAGEIRLMVQSLLEDRFKLVAHIEPREMRFLALVRARPDGPLGPGLVLMDECSPAIVNELRRKFPEKYPTPGGGMTSACSSAGLGSLADLLSLGQDIPIIDATGLKESFYFTIRSQFSPASALFGSVNNDPNLPALSTALTEQLGLKLEARRGPLDVLVIDSVEEPSEN